MLAAAGEDGRLLLWDLQKRKKLKALDGPGGAVICVAEGTYAEPVTPGEKHFTLARADGGAPGSADRITGLRVAVGDWQAAHKQVRDLDEIGNYTAAEPLLLQALEIRRRTPGEDSPDFVTSLNNLAGLYSTLGRYGEAEQLYQRALDLVRAAIGEDNEYFLGALINLASLYKAMGHYAAAEPMYQQALAF